jgi:hypothetical protein
MYAMKLQSKGRRSRGKTGYLVSYSFLLQTFLIYEVVPVLCNICPSQFGVGIRSSSAENSLLKYMRRAALRFGTLVALPTQS